MSTKVARRAVSSGGDHKGSAVPPSWKPLNRKITDHALYPYLLRLAILTYRTQPRFRYGNNASEERLTPISSRSHSRRSSLQDNLAMLTPENSHSSISGHLGHHSSVSFGGSGMSSSSSDAAPSFSSKISKEALKLLQTRLKAIALKIDHANDDPPLRRSYLAFYAMLLTPDFMKRMKESRRAEELIMMFLSCAAKELNKLAVSPSQLRGVVDKHAVEFVLLLIGVIREAGGGSSSARLIKQLESYKSSLENDTMISIRNTSNGDTAATQPVAVPTFNLSDMVLAQDLGKLLFVADSELQRDIDMAKIHATETRAVGELRFIERDLIEHQKHPVYSRQDFSSASEFQLWKDAELEQISQQINHFSNGRSIPNVVSPEINADTSEYDFFYFPEDPRSFYRHLLKRCLELDTRSAGRELSDNPQNPTILLSKQSNDLLTKASTVWRIPATTRSVLLLDVAEELFSDETLSIEGVRDSFTVARYLSRDTFKREWSPSSWPTSDRMLFTNVLTALQTDLVARIGKFLEMLYHDSPPQLGPLLEILEEHIFSLDRFDGYLSLFPTELQIDRLRSILISVAEDKYDQLIDNIPRDNSLDLLHIIGLADQLVSIAKRLSKRYKTPLFGELHISFISTERHLTLFAADSQSMFNHLMAHNAEEPSFEDVIVLYKKLVEIRDLYDQVNTARTPFGFDIEKTFYPFIIKWAETSSDLAISWVDPAVESDKFVPIDADAGALNSTSVNDLFASFNSALALIRDLRWKNQIHVAQIQTILLKGISAATCRYSNRLFQLFMEELRAKDDETNRVKTRQDKWIAIAKTAVNVKERFVPFNFLTQTFVKLNDIELAQKNLDKIENDIDSELQFTLLSQAQKSYNKRPNSFIFTVRIVQAEGLKACDMNGLSDPYVTIIDQQTRKSIGKTRTIYEDLNPIWDETFEVVTSGPKWLTATIWDENSITNHDLCGRAFIRLDPTAFEDFLSQDYWLDLDTQGKLLVNIGMESEKDDIRFHFGKAFRTLVRTENDMIRMIVEKFTAAVKYSISINTIKALQGKGGFNIETVSSWLSSTRISNKQQVRLTQVEVEDSLNPLFDYLNDNFATLSRGLTKDLKIKVMSKTWRVVLQTVESLLLPPLSDKRTTQTQLSQTETDIVFTWLSCMRDFFHHDGAGPSLEILQSQKYQELMTIPVYYDLSTGELKKESEKMASLSFKTLQERNYFALPELIKRRSTVMAHRNKKALKQEEEKIRNAERESPKTEDIILQILRARGEYEYLTRRLKQRERIAQTLATESIIKIGVTPVRRSTPFD